MTVSDMYQEVILDYYRTPKNRGKMTHPDAAAHDVNTSCGDEITIQLKLKNDKITEAVFDAKGCVISQAAASMLLESILGKTLEEARRIEKKDVLDLLGIDVSPMRLKCALLGLKVLKMAVYQKMGEKIPDAK